MKSKASPNLNLTHPCSCLLSFIHCLVNMQAQSLLSPKSCISTREDNQLQQKCIRISHNRDSFLVGRRLKLASVEIQVGGSRNVEEQVGVLMKWWIQAEETGYKSSMRESITPPPSPPPQPQRIIAPQSSPAPSVGQSNGKITLFFLY